MIKLGAEVDEANILSDLNDYLSSRQAAFFADRAGLEPALFFAARYDEVLASINSKSSPRKREPCCRRPDGLWFAALCLAKQRFRADAG